MDTYRALDNQVALPGIRLVYLPGNPDGATSLLIARDMRNRTIAVLSLDIHGYADSYAATIYEPVLSSVVRNAEQIAAHMLDQALRIAYAAGVRHVRCETWSGTAAIHTWLDHTSCCPGVKREA